MGETGMSAMNANVVPTETPVELIPCGTCGLPAPINGEPCPRCGSLTGRGPDTLQLDFRSLVGEYAKHLRGEAFIPNPNAIKLEIDGQIIYMPDRDTIVVGRATRAADADLPDVDLTPFSAAQQGVSRAHLRLARRSNLVYVTDLDSRNGTWLNGKRLVGQNERLVRDGDSLQLGKLKVTLRFGSPSMGTNATV